MSEERMTFKITTNDGKEMECEVLFTFQSDETNKNYIVYTDNTKDELGNIKVYASIYDPNAEEMTLQPVETEQEWNTIEQIMKQLQDSVRETIEINEDNQQA